MIGLDVSCASIELAKTRHEAEGIRFFTFEQYAPAADIDLAYCNGVFHHIPLAERAGALGYIAQTLRPGGLFAFWENNPWNPGTRLVMRRIPFDRDAKMLSAPHARRLLEGAGFEIISTDFLFVFPRALAALRPLESALTRVPAGAQYMVLCRRA